MKRELNRPVAFVERQKAMIKARDEAKAMYDLKRKWVTLDGHEASIIGWVNDFATVWSDVQPGGVSFSWPAVLLILQDDCAFKAQG